MKVEIVLVALGLTAAASVTDAAIQKIIYRSGITTLIILNKEMKYMKIGNSLEESGLLLKGVNETIENEAKT